MWVYKQQTGEFLHPGGLRLAFGFAGQGAGLNNPAQDHVHDVGPLPRGEYTMTAWIESDPRLGACVIVLEQSLANIMFGRDGFRIHGARSVEGHGLAAYLTSSEGCICLSDCVARRAIWNSGDRALLVEP
jgi:hypothetical protein